MLSQVAFEQRAIEDSKPLSYSTTYINHFERSHHVQVTHQQVCQVHR